MKWKSESKYFRWGVTAFLVFVSCLGFYFVLFHLANIRQIIGKTLNILMPVVFGMVIAYIMTPILNYIEYKILYPLAKLLKIKESKSKHKIIRGLSLILTCFLMFELLYGFIYMLVSEIAPSIMDITENFDQYVTNFDKYVTDITNWVNKSWNANPEIRDNILNNIDRYSGELEIWINDNILKRSTSFLMTISLSVIGILKICWNLIIGIIISIYVLGSKEIFCGQFKKIIFALFKQDTANIIINNFAFTHKTFSGFISGKVIDSVIIGILCFIGTSIMGTPYAALVSVIIGITNIIPFFGPALGMIPSAIFLLIVDFSHPLTTVYFCIFVLALQQFDGNILGPKILGESTGLTGFWVIFAITIFGGLFGVMGMIVGVPLLGVIYGALKSFLNAKLQQKNLPTTSKLYSDVCYVDKEVLHHFEPAFRAKKNSPLLKPGYGARYISKLEEKRSIDIVEQRESIKDIDSVTTANHTDTSNSNNSEVINESEKTTTNNNSEETI